MMAFANAIIVVATAALIATLYYLGAGAWSFWGFVLMCAIMSRSKDD